MTASTWDGWPVRKLKLLLIVNAMPISMLAKSVAIVLLELHEERNDFVEIDGERLAALCDKSRPRVSEALGKLEAALSPLGWIKLRRKKYRAVRVYWHVMRHPDLIARVYAAIIKASERDPTDVPETLHTELKQAAISHVSDSADRRTVPLDDRSETRDQRTKTRQKTLTGAGSNTGNAVEDRSSGVTHGKAGQASLADCLDAIRGAERTEDWGGVLDGGEAPGRLASKG